MTPFDQAIAGWHDFYLLLGTAAATLVGLIFIAASLHVGALRPSQDVDTPGNTLFTLMYQSFSNFVNVLLISAIFLMPSPGPNGLSISLIVVAVLGLAERGAQYGQDRNARTANRGRARPDRSAQRRSGQAFRFYIPVASYAVLVVIALILHSGNTEILYWLVLILLSLMVTGTRAAFILLVWDETNPMGGKAGAEAQAKAVNKPDTTQTNVQTTDASDDKP